MNDLSIGGRKRCQPALIRWAKHIRWVAIQSTMTNNNRNTSVGRRIGSWNYKRLKLLEIHAITQMLCIWYHCQFCDNWYRDIDRRLGDGVCCIETYSEVYWNPPGLLMVMVDNGNGSSKARVGFFFCFFLSTGFAFTLVFENICCNTITGGIDMAGLFPRYIDICRGAIITFVAAWIVQS